MVHAGTPGGRRLYGRTLADASARGLRLIGYDRPGYGGSTPLPGRSMADCANDASDICSSLGITRLAMWGLSGGGPHVLACAALLGDLVVAAACLSSLAPYAAVDLDWLAGFSQDAVDEVRLTLTDVVAARELFSADRDKLLAASANEVAQQMAVGVVDPDMDFLRDEGITMQEAVWPGIEGSWDDCVAQLSPWGFDLSDIGMPVLLMHGEQDRAVPISHGHWLGDHIPGVESRFFENEAHGLLREHHIDEVHAWLAERLR